MGVRILDVSRYQAGADLESLVRNNGIGMVYVQANDGTVRNPHYHAQVAACQRGGAMTTGYFYLRPNVRQTVDTYMSMTPPGTPTIVDAEAGSGNGDTVRQAHDMLRAAGYPTPLMYLPKWWWEQVGRPNLGGLPALIKSWYPDNNRRGFDAGLALLPGYVWDSYGGLPVVVVQFSGTGRLPGYDGDLDFNYFRGSREELATILGQPGNGGGTGGGGGGEDGGDFLMGLPQWQQDRIYERVLQMSAGVAGQNFNGFQFDHEENQRNAMHAKLDAIGGVVAQLAANDDNITLDEGQLATLTTTVSERVAAEVEEAQAAMVAKLDELAEMLADRTGADKEVVLEALSDFYRPAVRPETEGVQQ